MSIKSWKIKKPSNKSVIEIHWLEEQRRRYTVYIHVCWIKHPGLDLWNKTDTVHLFGASLTWNGREVKMFQFAREVRKVGRCCCWIKVNFLLIHELRYSQIWTLWQPPLSLSLYNIFKYTFKTTMWILKDVYHLTAIYWTVTNINLCISFSRFKGKCSIQLYHSHKKKKEYKSWLLQLCL